MGEFSDILTILLHFYAIYVQIDPISPIFAIWPIKWTENGYLSHNLSDLRPIWTHLPHICWEMNKKWLKTPHYPPYMHFSPKNSPKMNKNSPFLAKITHFRGIFQNILPFLQNIWPKVWNIWSFLQNICTLPPNTHMLW